MGEDYDEKEETLTSKELCRCDLKVVDHESFDRSSCEDLIAMIWTSRLLQPKVCGHSASDELNLKDAEDHEKTSGFSKEALESRMPGRGRRGPCRGKKAPVSMVPT